MSDMLKVTEVDGVRVVTFGDNVTTGEAYDMTQCYDEVKDGDVLHVLAEGVVGVMVEAWPTAISAESGAFHGLADGFTLADIDDGKYAAAAAVAGSLLQSGWTERVDSQEEMTMTADQINAKYRRDYDRLYVASMNANDAAESDQINERLAMLNKWRENQLAFVAIEADGLGLDLKEVLR